jgi:hypothetical protein
MKNLISSINRLVIGSIVLFSTGVLVQAAPVIRQAAGPNAAAIQAAVDQFRSDLGALNPNNGQSFKTGRREVNWDGVPDGFSSPNAFPVDFFNVNSPRGVVFSSTGAGRVIGTLQQAFQVSSNTASGVPVRFGNINPSYTALFQTFSAQRLFTISSDSNVVEVSFFIPGTNIPATVSGFGAVFADVDTNTTRMHFFDENGKIMSQPSGNVFDQSNGLTFQGVFFNAGERIAKVRIVVGNAPLNSSNTDGVNGVDVVAMDDFIYGEPRALDFHTGDFDGDGVTDINIFRPSTGDWFSLNSGSNTVSINHWGQTGDLPVDGDFDGDSLADLAVFRPADGTWWITKSTDGSFAVTQFGQNGDKPTTGDYDKDGKTDISVFRPSDGVNYFARSRDNFATSVATQFGLNGDIPVQGGAQ